MERYSKYIKLGAAILLALFMLTTAYFTSDLTTDLVRKGFDSIITAVDEFIGDDQDTEDSEDTGNAD